MKQMLDTVTSNQNNGYFSNSEKILSNMSCFILKKIKNNPIFSTTYFSTAGTIKNVAVNTVQGVDIDNFFSAKKKQ